MVGVEFGSKDGGLIPKKGLADVSLEVSFPAAVHCTSGEQCGAIEISPSSRTSLVQISRECLTVHPPHDALPY